MELSMKNKFVIQIRKFFLQNVEKYVKIASAEKIAFAIFPYS